jgi:PAS domain S-box-containing protein
MSSLITQQVQTERVQMDVRMLRIIVEYAPAAIAVFDRNMNYLAVSRRFVQDYRPAIPDLIGHSHYEAFPEISAEWRAIHQEALEGGMWKVTQEPFPRADGTLEWVQSELRPWYDETGTIGGLILVSDTVTERVLAQEALRESEERYRLLVESMVQGVLFQEADGRLTHANPAAVRILGISSRDLEGRTVWDPRWQAIYEDGSPFPPEEFPSNVALRTGQTVRNVVVGVANQVDGVFRWLNVHAAPRFRGGEDKPYQVYTTFEDITELKSTQQALQELNHTLEARVVERSAELADLYDNAPTGYHSLDAEGRIVRINRTELNWLGHTPDEVIGRPFTDFLTPQGREVFAANFTIFMQTGHVRDLEFDLVRKDGSTMSVLISATATFATDGTYVQSRSTVYDNSERKRAEQALRRANAEMARAVRLKDEFLANMSHELRTPLTGILALGENLQEQIYGPLNDRQLKTLRYIETSGRHLLDLINDLLDLSKIEAGRLDLEWDQLIVEDVCQASLVFVKEIAQKKEIDLQYHNAQPHAVIRADVRRLKQMLVNLLSNAVKFTPQGGRVQLCVKPNIHDQRIEFVIADTGVGIAPADQSRLFQPFTQLDSALTRQFEGTGLGLAMVKRLAAQHGGDVRLESTGVPGEGSRFTITLPYNLD